MSRKILIVDDEPDFMRLIIDIVGLFGIDTNNIIYCTQIDEGFSALRQEMENIACASIDMLIADPLNILKNDPYNLQKGEGEINGLKALRQMREMSLKLPIVCFTILSEQEGGIRDAVERYNATFICKTDANSVEKLIEFFKFHYG